MAGTERDDVNPALALNRITLLRAGHPLAPQIDDQGRPPRPLEPAPLPECFAFVPEAGSRRRHIQLAQSPGACRRRGLDGHLDEGRESSQPEPRTLMACRETLDQGRMVKAMKTQMLSPIHGHAVGIKGQGVVSALCVRDPDPVDLSSGVIESIVVVVTNLTPDVIVSWETDVSIALKNYSAPAPASNSCSLTELSSSEPCRTARQLGDCVPKSKPPPIRFRSRDASHPCTRRTRLHHRTMGPHWCRRSAPKRFHAILRARSMASDVGAG